jgi:hypothetical protein
LEAGPIGDLTVDRIGAGWLIRAPIGKTGHAMFVLNCAGRWLADLLERFDDTLVALDHDVDLDSVAH